MVASPATRPIGRSIAVGLGVALLVSLIGVAMIALPLFAFARATEPAHGVARPFIHDGLVDVAVPTGVVAGLATGFLTSRWYRRGGKLPQPVGFYEERK